MRASRTAVAAAAVIVTALTTAGGLGLAHAGETATGTPGAPGVGDRLFPNLGNGGYHARSYDVSLTYQAGSTKMPASTTMRATATQALNRFDLDSVGQTIAMVTVNGKPARFTTHDEELVISPATVLPKGRDFTTTVVYTADRSSDARPPDFPVPEFRNWINTPDGFALMGQPDRAHLFFPCNDHPSDKAFFTFRITVPDGLTALANGNLVSQTSTGGRTTYMYRTAHPMATDISQIAVGHFAVVAAHTADRLPLRSAVPASQLIAARPAIDRIPAQIAFLERTLGRPFPFETYGVLGLDSDFDGVALENQTMSTYPMKALAAPADQHSSTEIHELTHQYFGDAVSVETWSDMWLSEGHANFYQQFDTRPGHEAPVEDSFRQAYRNDATDRHDFGPPAAPSRPLAVLAGTDETGGLTLFALRQEIGPEQFRKVEQAFLDRYRDRSVTTQDYIDTVNQTTGRDLTGFLRAWLFGTTTPPMPGHPDWTTDPVGTSN